MMDRDTVRNMLSPNPKNKFEKLVLLFGFIISIIKNNLRKHVFTRRHSQIKKKN